MNSNQERSREACASCRKDHKKCVYDGYSVSCSRCAAKNIPCSLFPAQTGSLDPGHGQGFLTTAAQQWALPPTSANRPVAPQMATTVPGGSDGTYYWGTQPPSFFAMEEHTLHQDAGLWSVTAPTGHFVPPMQQPSQAYVEPSGFEHAVMYNNGSGQPSGRQGHRA